MLRAINFIEKYTESERLSRTHTKTKQKKKNKIIKAKRELSHFYGLIYIYIR